MFLPRGRFVVNNCQDVWGTSSMLLCPQCGGENSGTGNFCVFCGNTLGEKTPAQELGEKPAVEDRTLIPPLEEQVRRVRADLTALIGRLGTIEQALGIRHSGGNRLLPQSPTQPPDGPKRNIVSALQRWGWEQALGGNWLARLGVVVLVIGMGLFLRLAFESDWIGETERVALGIGGGLILLAVGEVWQSRYPTWAQALAGGAIAILYLSLYASHSFYQLLGTLPAFGFMLLVTVFAAVLALRYESMAIAVLGIIGGFATPLLFWENPPDQRILLAYILVLDLGVLALAAFRSWYWFNLLGLIGSILLYGFWYERYAGEASFLLAQGGITLIFLIFTGATSIFHLLWRRRPTISDYALILLNVSIYFGISYEILQENNYQGSLGVFTLLLAMFYGLVSYGALIRGREQSTLALLLCSIALILLTIVVPIQLDGSWVSMGWAIEGTILMWLSFRLNFRHLRWLSLGVLTAMVVRLLLVEASLDLIGAGLVFNQRTLAFIAGITALYNVAFVVWHNRSLLHEREHALLPMFLLAASFLTLWGISTEAMRQLGPDGRLPTNALNGAQSLSLTVIWALYSSIVLVIGIWKRSPWVRFGGLTLLGIVILKLFLIDTFGLERGYRVVAYMSLGFLLILGGFLYQKYGRSVRLSIKE